MPEPYQLAPEVEARIGTQGKTDLVVAVVSPAGSDDPEPVMTALRAGLQQHFPGLDAALLYVHNGGKPAPATPPGEALPVYDLPVPPGVESGTRPAALRKAFEIGQRLEARGFALIGVELVGQETGWMGRLIGPVLQQEHDLVLPYYLRHPYSGMVTNGILYPLIRAVYGRRIRYPLGAELACSARLAGLRLGGGPSPREGPFDLEVRLLTGAVAGGMRICQAALGPRVVAVGDGAATPSEVLGGVLSPIFAEMERTAALWQKIRGSAPLNLVGTDGPADAEPQAVDGKRLLDAFRLGQQNLREVWGLVLPPGTLVELKRIARLPDPEIRFPDRLWARILYDFSLAWRTRIMNRDHLAGALAPLYLGWFGALHAEMGDSDPARLEDRLEQLCLQFESEKPYLISRWRWPDRFIP